MLAVLLKSLYLVTVSMSTDLIILYHCLHCGGTFLLHFTCNMVGCCYNYIRIINSLHIYICSDFHLFLILVLNFCFYVIMWPSTGIASGLVE